MNVLLSVLGGAVLIAGIFIGVFSGSTTALLTSICTAAVLSALLFAVALLLENQQKILDRLDAIKRLTTDPPEKIICESCGESYTNDRASCPYCGSKPNADK